jgi:large subunit ribosomal protein L21
MSYAVIEVGGKQYVVHEGERLLVDRLAKNEGAVFEPQALLVDMGTPNLNPSSGLVSAHVVRHTLGEKVRIGKYKPKKGYRRHTGFRARLSQIQIDAIGAGKPARAAKAAEAPAAAPAKPRAARSAAKPTAKAETKAPAKPAAKAAARPAKPAQKPAPRAAAPKPAAKPAAKKPATAKAAAAKAPAKAKVEEAKKPAPKRAAPKKKAEK